MKEGKDASLPYNHFMNDLQNERASRKWDANINHGIIHGSTVQRELGKKYATIETQNEIHELFNTYIHTYVHYLSAANRRQQKLPAQLTMLESWNSL